MSGWGPGRLCSWLRWVRPAGALGGHSRGGRYTLCNQTVSCGKLLSLSCLGFPSVKGKVECARHTAAVCPFPS